MQQEVLLDGLWQLAGEASKAASGADGDPARLLCALKGGRVCRKGCFLPFLSGENGWSWKDRLH